jgi:hypothetical protein
MSDFDAFLTRSFAEAPEPADDGFSTRIGAAVAQREKAARLRTLFQRSGLGVAAAVLVYVAVGATFGASQDLLADTALGVARAVSDFETSGPGVLSQAQTFGASLRQTLGLGLTQILLAAGALLGGAVAYRSAQDRFSAERRWRWRAPGSVCRDRPCRSMPAQAA